MTLGFIFFGDRDSWGDPKKLQSLDNSRKKIQCKPCFRHEICGKSSPCTFDVHHLLKFCLHSRTWCLICTRTKSDRLSVDLAREKRWGHQSAYLVWLHFLLPRSPWRFNYSMYMTKRQQTKREVENRDSWRSCCQVSFAVSPGQKCFSRLDKPVCSGSTLQRSCTNRNKSHISKQLVSFSFKDFFLEVEATKYPEIIIPRWSCRRNLYVLTVR